MMYHLNKGKFLNPDVLQHECIPKENVRCEDDGTYTLHDFTTSERYIVQHLSQYANGLLMWRVAIPLDNLNAVRAWDIIHSIEEPGDIVADDHTLQLLLLTKTYMYWSYVPLDKSLTHIHAKASIFPNAMYDFVNKQLNQDIVVYGTNVYSFGRVVDIRDWCGDQPAPLEFGTTLWQLYRPLLRGP